MNFVPTVPSLSELLETLCVELRGHPHSARTASSSRLRWDRGRSRPSAECALADDGRLRRAPPKLTYVNHIRLGVLSVVFFSCLVTLRKYPGAKPNLTLTLTHTYRCSAAMLGASPRVRCVCASFLSAPLAGSPSSAPLSCGEVSMIHLSDETFYASR